jgi:hypothetical protein
MISKLPHASRAFTAAVAATALVIGFGGSSVKAFAHEHDDGWEDHEEAEERQEAYERHEAEEAREAWQQQEWQQQYAQPYGYQSTQPYGYYGYARPRVIYPPRGYGYGYSPQALYQSGSSLSFTLGY